MKKLTEKSHNLSKTLKMFMQKLVRSVLQES